MGAALLVIALWGFTTLNDVSALALVVGLHVALHVGLALVWTPVVTSRLNVLPPELCPHGSAISSTLQQVWGALGTALLVSVLAARAAPAGVPGSNLPVGLHAAFGRRTGRAHLRVHPLRAARSPSGRSGAVMTALPRLV